MSLNQFVAHLYGVATGWLGWSPHDAWHTPMPEIYLAVKARMQWARMMNGETERQETMAEKVARQFRSRT